MAHSFHAAGRPEIDGDIVPFDAERVSAFVVELGKHQRRLFLYILSMVPHAADAEDLLQETNVILWQKFSQFEPDTSFFSWASRIAYHKILQYREGRGRDAALVDESVVSAIAVEAEAMVDELEEQRLALASCLNRLKEKDRRLIALRYVAGASIEGLSRELGRPENSITHSLGRIREKLYRCIRNSLAMHAEPR